MYLKEQIQDLNEYGVLSCALLARKYRVNFEYGRKILSSIVDDYENVKFRSHDQIYIEGRELEDWMPAYKRILNKKKKPSRWKDVFKP